MTLIDGMRNLREDIESGKEVRSRRIKELKADLLAFMKEAGQQRKEKFQTLTERIEQRLADLKKEVKSLKRKTEVSRKENRAKQKELKKMLAEAKAAFWVKKSKAAAKRGGES